MNDDFQCNPGPTGPLIFNHSSKINNQKLCPPTWPSNRRYTQICFQYRCRVRVAVDCAVQPCLRSLLTAKSAASFEANSPYNVDPEPDSDAYFAPARSSAFLPSLSSGYSGKTTSSKSFLIPARTSARSGFSARPLSARPLPGAPE